MTEIIIIAALAKNDVIGKDGKMPWHIKKDLQRFKNLTLNHPVIMGHSTYNSLPQKPLPERKNIVLSRDTELSYPGVIVKNSFEEALDYCKKDQKVFIIGGKTIYSIGLNRADKLELTRIHRRYEGDTYFPKIDYDKWTLVNEVKKRAIDSRNNVPVKLSFLTYSRIKNKY